MSRIVIFGSTKDEIHLGCKALIDGLEFLIRDKIDKKAYIQHVSHRFLSPFFYKAYSFNQPSFKKNKLGFIVSKRNNLEKPDSTYNRWLKALNEMASKDVFLNLTLKNSDVIIINVEGSVHNQGVLGHQMLAIGKLAVKLGKLVYWVNFSTQNENNDILKDALSGAEKVAVRELCSYNYLKSLGIDVIQAFDTAVLAGYNGKEKERHVIEDENFCLFTGSNIKKNNLIDTARSIKAKGIEPYYLPLGLNDYEDYKIIKSNNIKSFDFNFFSYRDLCLIINQSKFVVSGRHHMNIFSLLAEKPFIPFRSNTWKIEGVCEMIDYDCNFEENLLDRINILINSYDIFKEKLEKAIPEVKFLSKNNL